MMILLKMHYLIIFQSNNSLTSSSSRLALNATIQPSVYEFFQDYRPEYIFLGSTLSGGITANMERPADFIYQNIQSASNIFYAAHKFAAKKVLFFASSCVYPKECAQPMSENLIMSGPVEPTSQPYSLAKLSGINMAQSFKKQYGLSSVVMIPATPFGPGFDSDVKTTHVIGALIHKFVTAAAKNSESVSVWGSGKPRREFLFIDDLVDASLYLMDQYDGDDVINVGVGEDLSIAELADLIAKHCQYKGRIEFDASKPDGTMQKLLDTTRMKTMGWAPKVSMEEGISKSIEWYKRKALL
jgi:GDP-L-fucose synthase